MLSESILTWYDENKKSFPWRSEKPAPYHVLLSEMMLQQTQTKTVVDYFLRFTNTFPSIETLADADVDEVMKLWQGLGYYRRARFLHQTAQTICKLYNGKVPKEYKTLRSLPGIGDYTARAIMAIAFKTEVLPVDGNIKRVFSRFYGLKTPYERLEQLITSMPVTFQKRPDALCQGLMDFANTICLPKTPDCQICPLQKTCHAFQNGKPEDFPYKTKKIRKSIKYAQGLVFVEDNHIILRKHEHGTLLGNLWNIPMSPFEDYENAFPKGSALGSIRHIFTHIDLRLDLYKVTAKPDGTLIHLNDLKHYPISRLTEKVLSRFIMKIG